MPPPASTTLTSLGPDLTNMFLQAGVITAAGTPEAKKIGETYNFLRKNREYSPVEKPYKDFTDLTKRWPTEWSKAAGDKAAEAKMKTEFVDAWAKLLKSEYELLHLIFSKYEEMQLELSDARDKCNAAEERAKKAEESVKKVLGVEEAVHHDGHDDHGHHGPEPTEKKGFGKWYLGLAIAGIFFLGMFAYWGMFDKSKTWKESSIAANVKLDSCLKERDAAKMDFRNADGGFFKVMNAVDVKADGTKTYGVLADEMIAVCQAKPEPEVVLPDYIVERWKLNFVDGSKSRIVGLCPRNTRPQLKRYDEEEFDAKEYQWLEVKCLEE